MSLPYVDAKLPAPKLMWDCEMGLFVLTEDYVTPEITVPAWEVTDGATRPHWAALYLEKYDKHFPACIVHDYMYRHAIGTKKEADDLFELNLHRCAKHFGFDEDKIFPMVLAVRAGGQGAYPE